VNTKSIETKLEIVWDVNVFRKYSQTYRGYLRVLVMPVKFHKEIKLLDPKKKTFRPGDSQNWQYWMLGQTGVFWSYHLRIIV